MRQPILAVLLPICCAPMTPAQDANTQLYPEFEFFAGNSGQATSYLTMTLPNIGRVSLNGADARSGLDAGVIRNISRYFGIQGDFSLHFNRYHEENGVQCNDPSCPVSTQAFDNSSRLFQFFVGPETKWSNRTRFGPFVHALFGLAHVRATFKTAGSLLDLSQTDNHTGFAMAYGGGLDVRIVRRAGLRMSVDYSLNYGVGGPGASGSSERMDTFRISVGAIFH
jgi:hypothetical protein